MFTQITIIKIGDAFKVTFFNANGVLYSETITEISELLASAKVALEQLVEDPRSAYAKP